MTELQEMTTGKNLVKLFKELKFQIKIGETFGGTICSHIVNEIELNGGKILTKNQYKKIHSDYKGIWNDPQYIRYKGLRTAMLGECALSIENYHFIII